MRSSFWWRWRWIRDPPLGSFGSRKTRLRPSLPSPLVPLRFHRLLPVRFRIALAHQDGGGIARYVPDQALFLRCGDYRLMQLLRQLSPGEFGEGAGKLRLMRQRSRRGPAAELPQGFIDAQARDQVARGRKIQNGFGHESGGQSGAVLRGPAGDGAPRR